MQMVMRKCRALIYGKMGEEKVRGGGGSGDGRKGEETEEKKGRQKRRNEMAWKKGG